MINSVEVAISILRRRGFGHAASDLELTKKRLEGLLQINQFLVNHKDELAPDAESALAIAIGGIKSVMDKLNGR